MGPTATEAITAHAGDATQAVLPHGRWLRAGMRGLFRVKGGRAVAHAIRQRLASDEVVWIDDFDGDLRFQCRLGEHMGNQIYWRGTYSWSQLRVLDTILTSEMTFVDVGANHGEFTVFAAKRLTSGHVYAFEPMTEMFGRLDRNVQANHFANVTTVPLGVWDEATTHTIYTSPDAFDDGMVNEGLGTLFPHAARTEPVETITTTTLDDFVDANDIARVDVVKIDIEGAELRALRGAERTLAHHRPVVVVEADRGLAAAAGAELEDLYDHLAATHEIAVITRSGKVRPVGREGLADQQNLLCTPRSA